MGRPFGTPQNAAAREAISKGMKKYYADIKKATSFYETYGPSDREPPPEGLEAHDTAAAVQAEHEEEVNKLLGEIQRLKFYADRQPDNIEGFEGLTWKDDYRTALEKLKKLRGE